MAELTKSVEYVKHKCLQCGSEFEYDKGRKQCSKCNAQELLSIAPDPLIGMLLAGKYRIESLLGSGGMGRVYAGVHEHLNVPIAVKVLPDTGMSVDRLQRFQHEAKQVHAICHPNLVRVLDFGVVPAPFIVMEKASGRPLSELIKPRKGLDAKVAINIGMAICDAMTAAHKVGLLHRDLKPSNIIVDMESNSVKVIDFGLVKSFVDDVKLTRTGETVGSPPYMSPEQCRGEQIDERSDIYSFGCLLYEVLTGVLAFDGDNMIASIFKHLETQATPLSKIRPDVSFPKGLETVITNCLSKDVETRYQTMNEVKADLQKVLDGKKVTAIPPKKVRKKNRAVKKFFTIIGSATLTIVMVPILVLLFPEKPPALVPPKNELAVGAISKVAGEVDIKPQPRMCLNGIGKSAFFALRQKQLDQYSNLLAKKYTPFEWVFQSCDFSKTWLSFEGLYYLGKPGPTAVQGKSIVSEPVLNPLLLIQDSTIETPEWRTDFIKNQKRISDFPYGGGIKDWWYNPAKSVSEVSYDLNDYYENLLELNDWTEYGNGSGWFYCDTTNALDFGYNYMVVTLKTDQGTELLTPKPQRIYEIYHQVGNFWGNNCNCAHVPSGDMLHYAIQKYHSNSATKTYKLYRTEPRSVDQKPDFTFVVRYEYTPETLTDLDFLNQRLEKVIASDGRDATTLLSIYRRLGDAYKLQHKWAASMESYGEALRIASLHPEASEDLNDYILPEFAAASAGHADAVNNLRSAQQWTAKTKDLVHKVITGDVDNGADWPWTRYSTNLFDEGLYEEAAAIARKGLKFRPADAQLLLSLSSSLGALGNWKESAEAARQALAIGPDYPPALCQMSYVLNGLGKYAEATQFANKCLATKPEFAPALLNLANAQFGMKNYRGAEATASLGLAKGTDIDGDPPSPATRSGLLLTLGKLFQLNGEIDAAESMFEQAHSSAPESPEGAEAASLLRALGKGK